MKNPLWGGRFSSSTDELMKKINSSIKFDKELYREDIEGSIAHCRMLVKQDIISEEDGDKIILGLKDILTQIDRGVFEFDDNLEDIHMNIEYHLYKSIGDVAGKLHTARSRNDQVATDLKLWTHKAIIALLIKVEDLQNVIINLAEKHYDTIMPGFTHLQIAQPITFGHHLMAYFEMLKRDYLRFKDLDNRIDECPLGSAALAGTSFPIDRHFVAKELKFKKPTENSIDSVSDRDYVIEFLSNCSILIMHLSRLAEELILWCSSLMNFIELSDSMTTGSSIMPQKRNPDAAELIRAKTGSIFSSLQQLLTIMKGLPLAYSKDMQEDKIPLFHSFKDVLICIDAMTQMLKSMKVNKENMKLIAEREYSTATDLADWLVKKLDIPFRKSHEITGRIVASANTKNCKLHELSLKELQSFHPDISNEIFLVLTVENSVNKKLSYGGTSPIMVMEAISRAKSFIKNSSIS